jgi:hypothetical protein
MHCRVLVVKLISIHPVTLLIPHSVHFTWIYAMDAILWQNASLRKERTRILSSFILSTER